MAQLHLPSNDGVMDPKRASAFAQVWNIFFSGLASKANASAAVAAVASPNAAAAPVGYSQAHIDTIVTELNETKAQLNALLAALNT